jgi:leucyl aminopeptidase (aminopeptidase T)
MLASISSQKRRSEQVGDFLMGRGAKTVIETCAGARPGEHVLIVADTRMSSFTAILAAAAWAAQCEPMIVTMVPRSADGQEPPPAIAAAMKSTDIFVCPVSTSITHTRAVKEAAEAGARGIMLTQFTENMLVSGGIEADFLALAPICQKVADAMAGCRHIHLTTSSGTDLTLSATGRRGNALTCLVKPGQFSPVPNVEANVSPVEGSANGVIIVNASIPYAGIGLLTEPVRCEVAGGFITSITGGSQADMLRKSLASRQDPNVYNIAELGVGLNPKCRFTGIMLEDEGVFGSVHIGTGTSLTLGGNVKAACHYDLIMTGATIVADGRTVLANGEVTV